MSLFPKVQSPCPYKGKFADIMQGSQCRLCKREVVDLTDMETAERKQFLSACETEVCVSYRVGARSVLAAMAMSTVAISTVAEAQDSESPEPIETDITVETYDAVEDEEHDEVFYIIVGGMRKPGEAEWLEDKDTERHSSLTKAVLAQEGMADGEKPALPVEYDDEFETEAEPVADDRPVK